MTLAKDLRPGEAVVGVMGDRLLDKWWLARGEWVLHWRTAGLTRPKSEHHDTLDRVMAASRKLGRHAKGELRHDVKITYRDTDPAAGVSAFADDARERLAQREREEQELQARDRGLGPKAVRAARKESGAKWSDVFAGGFALMSFLIGHSTGGDERGQQQQEGTSDE